MGIAFFIVMLQLFIGPRMVEWMMRIRYIPESESPKLHSMVEELSTRAGIPKPRVGISEVPLPNAFAFGKSKRSARVCVTRELLRRLDEDELRSVLAHEISHIKHRDVVVITMLSVIPLICYYIFFSLFWGSLGSRENRGLAMLVALLAFLVYFITNLLVLYASRIREYYADVGSVELTNKRHTLASALYKIVHGSARYDREQLKSIESTRAFFANDPKTARRDLYDLRSADLDMDGRIDEYELETFAREAKVRGIDRLLELFSTHPNLVKRIKALAS
jgi:heat shock protein HtpX